MRLPKNEKLSVKYTLGQEPKLIRYIDDGHLFIDNNRAERTIKPQVIGKENWLFSNTPNGAYASAMLYAFIDSPLFHFIRTFFYLLMF